MVKLKTFTHLSILQQARETAQENLLDKYDESVRYFIETIQQVMNVNGIGHFEAMKLIQDKTELSDSIENKIMFAAALLEIVEDKYFKNEI